VEITNLWNSEFQRISPILALVICCDFSHVLHFCVKVRRFLMLNDVGP